MSGFKRLLFDHIIPPCKDCENRCLYCHETCEAYQNFLRQRENEKEEYRKNGNTEHNAYRHDVFTKIRHREKSNSYGKRVRKV